MHKDSILNLDSEWVFNINTYHGKRINEIAVNGVEGARVVIRRCTYCSQIYGLKSTNKLQLSTNPRNTIHNTQYTHTHAYRKERKGVISNYYQICHLDETFEPRIVFDVEAVEVNATVPRERVGFQEVFDLVVVDIQGEDLVRGL